MVDLEKAKFIFRGGSNDHLINTYYEAMLKELSAWRENVTYMLDYEPKAVRVHEGGEAEDLMMSLAVTFGKLQKC